MASTSFRVQASPYHDCVNHITPLTLSFNVAQPLHLSHTTTLEHLLFPLPDLLFPISLLPHLFHILLKRYLLSEALPGNQKLQVYHHHC